METVTHLVGELGAVERLAMERLLGHRLSDEQQLIIHVKGSDVEEKSKKRLPNSLPDWCNVYKGMTDEEIDEVDRSIVRDYSSRTIE
jgi:hypothetical protein